MIEYRPNPQSNVFADLFDAKMKAKSVENIMSTFRA